VNFNFAVMLRKLRFLTLFVILISISEYAGAQCFSYAKHVCKGTLEGYLHDGNYNATILSEGESAEIYKTFFSGQGYRVAVCKVDDLPDVTFKIIDGEKNVLFDSKQNGNPSFWDFKIETTQQLTVHVEVAENDPDSETKISGCVSILFGIKR
jgi:hypothetical protein